jgi:hypothetical protein
MSAVLTWLKAAPEGAIALVTAVLAAVVAVFVTVLTQWILGRRGRTELLTKKLEELYLALNEAAAHNVTRTNAALPLATATPFNRQNVSGSRVEELGLDLHKKMVMYVRLYFPQLAGAHQRVFHRNREVNVFIHEAETGPPLSEDRLLELSGVYGEALRVMESEIIENRRVLVRDTLLPRRYRRRA